jgi:hypothetical protein
MRREQRRSRPDELVDIRLSIMREMSIVFSGPVTQANCIDSYGANRHVRLSGQIAIADEDVPTYATGFHDRSAVAVALRLIASTSHLVMHCTNTATICDK